MPDIKALLREAKRLPMLCETYLSNRDPEGSSGTEINIIIAKIQSALADSDPCTDIYKEYVEHVIIDDNKKLTEVKGYTGRYQDRELEMFWQGRISALEEVKRVMNTLRASQQDYDGNPE